jgi:hypothetical protein
MPDGELIEHKGMAPDHEVRPSLEELLAGEAHGAESGQDLRRANEMLQAILEKLQDKTHPMLREDHEACWQKWVGVKETIKIPSPVHLRFQLWQIQGRSLRG